MQIQQFRSGLAVLTAAAFTVALQAAEGEGIIRHQPGGGPPVKVHGDVTKLEKMTPNVVQLGDLPAAAQEALRAYAAGATIERIVKPPIFYIVELTLEGTAKAFWVSEDATRCEGPAKLNTAEIQAVSTPVQWAALPEAAQRLVSSKFEGAPLGEIHRVNWGYEALLNREGQKSSVRVAEDGRILPRRQQAKGRPAGPEHRHAVEGGQERHEPAADRGPAHTNRPVKEQP